MTIRDLGTHPAHFVTVAELAEYWGISRQQIHKRIESGSLAAVRFGSRLYRVPTQTALAFEQQVSVLKRAAPKNIADLAPDRGEKLPAKIGLQRVRRMNRR